MLYYLWFIADVREFNAPFHFGVVHALLVAVKKIITATNLLNRDESAIIIIIISD